MSQESIDRFYWHHGPCCAGCDWWHAVLGGAVGQCRKAAPVSGAEIESLLGITYCSLKSEAGHPLTLRDYHCGNFKDEFDWSSLPIGYIARIRRDQWQKSPPHA